MIKERKTAEAYHRDIVSRDIVIQKKKFARELIEFYREMSNIQQQQPKTMTDEQNALVHNTKWHKHKVCVDANIK